jgi:hypothetical protein
MVCAESAALVYVERVDVGSRDVRTGEEEEGALAGEREGVLGGRDGV